MTKNIYVQPLVIATEMVMVQTLCASSGDSGSTDSGRPLSSFDPNATTDVQL